MLDILSADADFMVTQLVDRFPARPRRRRASAALGVGAATVLVVALGLATWASPVRHGLSASLYRTPDWSGGIATTASDSRLTTTSVIEAWRGAVPDVFSITWAGALLVLIPGTYTLATISDDGSWLYVDGARVVDNGGVHGAQLATGRVFLDRGVHAIRVQYVQQGGEMHFEWKWARDAGPLGPVPAWALATRRVAFWPFAASAALQVGLAAAEWLCLGLLVAWGAAWNWGRVMAMRTPLRLDRAWPALPLIILGSMVLNGIAVWWGLPGGNWAPDELLPEHVALGLAQRFSNGWFDRYPPFHYYVLTAAYVPVWLLEALGRLKPGGIASATAMTLLGRCVSLAAGAGTVVLVYACGTRTVGTRAALFGAAMFALVVPFLYYAKTANLDVPYLFWSALAIWYYLRVLQQLKTRDFIAFAAAAALAVCTKDQAYGLFVLTPPVVIHRLWQARRATGERLAFARALVDRRVLAAAGTTAILFAACHNLLFNSNGFLDHLRLITGAASESYRMFPRTLAGERALFALTVDVARVAWGWPFFLVSIGGFVVAWLTPRTRRAALVLTVPMASYYVTFIAVVGYSYDRFLLPIFFLLAPFGGLLLDRFIEGRPLPNWRVPLVGLAFTYSLLYAATVDVLMLRDSRFAVERFLHAQSAAAGVGFVFPVQYYPRLNDVPVFDVRTIEELKRADPKWFVLNADYARAEPSSSPIGLLIAGLESGALGYRAVYRVRMPAPFPWLPAPHRDLAGSRDEPTSLITSALRDIDPAFEVFERHD